VKIALTIAGSDSGAGAGVQADLKTFAAHGVYGASVITAVTAQNTVGITQVLPLPADLVTAQMEAIAGDMRIDVVKTGMLPTAAIVEAVAAAVDMLELPKLVVDPVMAATSGDPLADDEAVAAMKAELLCRALAVTPNVREAERLSGVPIHTVSDMREAARRILPLGPSAVIVTGGHVPGPDVVDVLFDGVRTFEFSSPRVHRHATHGTGCTFASALAANLALGYPLPDAVQRAKAYVVGAIRHSPPIGGGRAVLDHFWNVTRATTRED
jgi:hydroxymethylpyrimidine/phosphomethylpyrimidine kinase